MSNYVNDSKLDNIHLVENSSQQIEKIEQLDQKKQKGEVSQLSQENHNIQYDNSQNVNPSMDYNYDYTSNNESDGEKLEDNEDDEDSGEYDEDDSSSEQFDSIETYGPSLPYTNNNKKSRTSSNNNESQLKGDKAELDEEEIERLQMEMIMKKYYNFQKQKFNSIRKESSSDDDDFSYPFNFFSNFYAPKPLEPWKEPESLEEKRALYACGDNFVEALSLPKFPQYFVEQKLKKPKESDVVFKPNPEINEIITLWRGDSTYLECDAVVNAANSSLLGGGGIDGQIHDKAGRHLLEECRKLDGCKTGFTKITNGYKLPAKKILHTVGPTTEDPIALASCYRTCLELAIQYNLRTIGFCCVSTGIYGYPLRKATHVALKTVREFLEEEENYKKFDRIVFVVYKLDAREERVYRRFIPRYFPLETYPEETQIQSDSEDETPRYPTSFTWRFYKSDSDESTSSDSDSSEESYFNTYFRNRGGKMPWE